jgi:hypothetical protein
MHGMEVSDLFEVRVNDEMSEYSLKVKDLKASLVVFI